jgi:hypothetical protein
MKKLHIFLILFFTGWIITEKNANAGCIPAWFLETSPSAGGFLYDKTISFTFVGNGGSMSVVGGYIRIYKKSDNTVVDSINITDYYPVGSMGLSQGKFVFPVTSVLECNTEFYILIDYHSFTCIEYYWFDVIRDPHGIPYEWNFTTAPTPIKFTPGYPAYFCGGGTSTLKVNEANSYIWSNGATSRTVTVTNPDPYSVTVTYVTGCSATGSSSIATLPADYVPICMVTVDSLSQYNQVIWTKPFTPSIDSFIVYREVSTDIYKRIGAVPYQGALSIFTDTVRMKYFPNTGDPNAGTYRYKLQVVDTCGSYSALSPYHNTIFISNSNGTFTWPRLYSIENGNNPVNSYILMRDDSSSGNWHAINSVTGTQYTVTDPAYSVYKDIARWRIETQWSIVCIPSKDQLAATYSTSRSNKTSKVISGISEPGFHDLFLLFPNPAVGKFTIEIQEQYSPGLNIRIYNCTGQLILEHQTTNRSSAFDLSDHPPGIYYLQALRGTQSYLTKVAVVNCN